MPRHTIHIENAILQLKKMTHSLGAHVEENVGRAVRSIINRDAKLATEVMHSDSRIDEMEVELEEECLKVLALYQPVANDLRLVVAYLKINNDLERIGDLAVNIAERSVFLADQVKLAIPDEFPLMAEKTQWMLQHALDSLVDLDSVMARRVCAVDDEVDDLNRKMFYTFESQLGTGPEKLRPLLELLSASRYLERVADHATNICEDVIYLIGGEIVRHRKEALIIPMDQVKKSGSKS
ncbi:MAG: phosphate signaling complex protein PhoU [Candidatus Nitronauta litoralis]|uniref:Phosphate-specific transport system accessory protein PhoU n=1 Tax=Candidatus Nitronauta litoralis TaxID=2705533 RepID=A0A7T0BWW6_9BACT|nr:MAG: phosphate signaling complex protein PhoU [Candidatus Nitronauta litoralis]